MNNKNNKKDDILLLVAHMIEKIDELKKKSYSDMNKVESVAKIFAGGIFSVPNRIVTRHEIIEEAEKIKNEYPDLEKSLNDDIEEAERLKESGTKLFCASRNAVLKAALMCMLAMGAHFYFYTNRMEFIAIVTMILMIINALRMIFWFLVVLYSKTCIRYCDNDIIACKNIKETFKQVQQVYESVLAEEFSCEMEINYND